MPYKSIEKQRAANRTSYRKYKKKRQPAHETYRKEVLKTGCLGVRAVPYLR